MPVYRLDERLVFPPPERGPRWGPIAVGGDLRPERLLLAYSMGIFPWQGEPLHWHSPDPRMVLLVEDLRVAKSLTKTLRQGRFHFSLDRAFAEVMVACATVPRPGQDGTWITPQMVTSYTELHRRGVAHSVEAWEADQLVGGLYGLSLGAAFFGESMFSHARDASKAAFVTLVRQLARWSIPLVDCQVYTPHLASFGATEWPRREFLAALASALERPTRLGPWRLDEDLAGGRGVSAAAEREDARGARRSRAKPDSR
jgi:leucyl/phenylalanyl-tRNA--protein transferase